MGADSGLEGGKEGLVFWGVSGEVLERMMLGLFEKGLAMFGNVLEGI